MKRIRKFGESMRQVDPETLRLIAADRLAQLERDQAASAIDAPGGEDDLWEMSDESDKEGKAPQKRRSIITGGKRAIAQGKMDSIVTRGQRRNRRTIEMVLMDEPAFSKDRDTFVSIEAPPASSTVGVRPPLKLCSVCSYISTYKCLRCGSNFCSLECNSIHKDTKCLKFAD
jgi:zinc finger HIT domain-containing protein 1